MIKRRPIGRRFAVKNVRAMLKSPVKNVRMNHKSPVKNVREALRGGGLIFVAALVGAVAYGDGFDLHLVYSPAATDGAGHGGADIDDAAAVEGAAVAHAHVATLAGLETGDAHHTGQGQGAVCRVFAALGQALAHGTDGAAIVVHRGLTR